MTRPRGRPAQADAPVPREDMVTAALDLLDAGGAEAFTMRALGERLGVTPMTIHHHFGGRDGLIAAMSHRIYDRVVAPEGGTPVERIAGLLRAYHAQVLAHPGLTMLIFGRPEVFPAQAQRITDDLSTLLSEAGLSPRGARVWLEILVDFTHGAALAIALGHRAETEEPVPIAGYEAALAELLSRTGR